PEAGAGEGEGFAHGAGDDESFTPGEEGEGTGGAFGGEFGVGLVDDEDAAGGGVGGVDGVEADGGSGGVVGAAEEDDVGVCRADPLGDGVGAELVAGVAFACDPLGACACGDDGVHGVG